MEAEEVVGRAFAFHQKMALPEINAQCCYLYGQTLRVLNIYFGHDVHYGRNYNGKT